MNGTDKWDRENKKCDNPGCKRQVHVGTHYCCGACAQAHDGKYEIHEDGPLGHSDSCNKRFAERGPFDDGFPK